MEALTEIEIFTEIDKRDAYVYRHRRLDDFSIFYVGIGSGKKYARANAKMKRSKEWKELTKNVSYSTEIIADNLTKKEAGELEILLISCYGRKDLNTGNLVNKTGGGQGMNNPNEEWSKSHSEKMSGNKNPMYGLKGENHPAFGYKATEEAKALRSQRQKGENSPNWGKVGKDCNSIRVIIDQVTNKIYYGRPELSKETGFKVNKIGRMLLGKQRNDTTCIYLEDHEKGLKYDELWIDPNIQCIKVINILTKVIYKSPADAAKCEKLSVTSVRDQIKLKRKNTSNLYYLRDYTAKNFTPFVFKRSDAKEVINTITGEIYESVIMLCKSLNIGRSKMDKILKDKSKNNTPYMYLSDYEKLNTLHKN